MSDVALLNAVEKRLRTALGDADGRFVGVQLEGVPPPAAGSFYVSIDAGPYRNSDMNPQSLDEFFGVTVTLAFKMQFAPKDRRAGVAAGRDHVRGVTRTVITALHCDYQVLNDANAELGAAVNGFVEPLRFARASPAVAKAPDWIGGKTDHPDRKGIYVRTVEFADARRVQRIDGPMT